MRPDAWVVRFVRALAARPPAAAIAAVSRRVVQPESLRLDSRHARCQCKDQSDQVERHAAHADDQKRKPARDDPCGVGEELERRATLGAFGSAGAVTPRLGSG